MHLIRWSLLGLTWAASAVAWAAQAPQASFVISPTQPSTNDVVLLDAGASTGAVAYAWDFDGDGAVDLTSDQPQVSRFFDQEGAHEVSLTALDAGGVGDTTVQTVVVSLAPVSARRTIETSLGGNRVLAGGTIVVVVTLSVNQPASGLGLAETLPTGWRARALDDDGALFKRSGDQLQWLWPQSLGRGDVMTVRYELDVPETAPRGNVRLEGSVSSFSPNRFNLSVQSLHGVEVL